MDIHLEHSHRMLRYPSIVGFVILFSLLFGYAVYNRIPLAMRANGKLAVKMQQASCSLKSNVITNLLEVMKYLQELEQSPEQGCRDQAVLFHRMFELTHQIGKLEMTPIMLAKMKQWLGGREDLVQMAHNQDIIHVMNKWTYSATILNLIRSKRPKLAGKGNGLSDRQYIDKLAEELRPTCNFCDLKQTAIDPFGRIIGNHSYTAANVFMLDEWHSLVIFKTHHPSDWGYAEFSDSFSTTRKWFNAVYDRSPQSVYPMVFWDLMGHAGGSQLHPHYHPIVNKHGYYGYLRKWQQVAEEYGLKYSRNYFSDQIQTHSDIGLAVRWGSASAFTPINPKKDYEIIIIGSDVNKDFIDLMYFVIRAYFEDLGKYCFSCGIAYPPLDNSIKGLPAIARLITRGSVSSVNTDVSSMELFAASLVETDPYISINVLKRSIDKRQSELI